MIVNQKWVPYCIYFLFISFVGAQETQTTKEPESESAEVATVLKDTLSVHISTKLFQNDSTLIWGTDVSRLTIPGRAVTLNLKNDQATLSVHFTPYKKNGEVLLIAQSEIWLKEKYTEELPPSKNISSTEKSQIAPPPESTPSNNKEVIRYFTSIKSAPMKYGEQLVFFPLGKINVENNQEEIYIEMAINIDPYEVSLDNENRLEPEESSNDKVE